MTTTIGWHDLGVRMLRAPIFVRLMAPFLLALSLHGTLANPGVHALGALASLALLWAASTAWNDLGDRGADAVNLADDPSRPLARGEITRRRLRAFSIVAAACGIGLIAAASARSLPVLVVLALLSLAYSLPPLRLGSRPGTPYAVLGICFGAGPYLTAVTAIAPQPDVRDIAVAAVLAVMFAGRMLLKDFRDTAGDRAIGKPTFLLRNGHRRTARLAAGLVTGAAAALLPLTAPTWLGGTVSVLYVAACALLLGRLSRQSAWSDQCVSIVLLVRTSALYFLALAIAAMSASGALGLPVAMTVDATLAAAATAALGLNSPAAVARRLAAQAAPSRSAMRLGLAGAAL